jgi:acetyl-CoA carboxylase carboxyl transferase subunit beta
VAGDPLKFRDQKKYADRLRENKNKTGLEDSIVNALGSIEGLPIVACLHDFNFMGGSLGIAAGEAIIKAFEAAIEKKRPLVLYAASGGARMQEGILSLMQLPRTTVGVQMPARSQPALHRCTHSPRRQAACRRLTQCWAISTLPNPAR